MTTASANRIRSVLSSRYPFTVYLFSSIFFAKIMAPPSSLFFFLNDPAPPEISTLPLPAALPFCVTRRRRPPTRRVSSHNSTARSVFNKVHAESSDTVRSYNGRLKFARRRFMLSTAAAALPPVSAASASMRRISQPLERRTCAAVVADFASGQKGTDPPNLATPASPLIPVLSHFARASFVVR